MSALDGWIDVCREGRWIDATGRRVHVTAARLSELAEGYKHSDPAPVVIGHPETDAPAWAWIEALRVNGDRLQAKLRNIAPAFRQAVEAGRYAGRSIAYGAAGVRHLAFLGGRAPAVSGLAPTQFAAPVEHAISFTVSDGGELAAAMPWQWEGFAAMAALARGMRDAMIASDGLEAADRLLPEYQIETLERAAIEAEREAGGRMMAGPADPARIELAAREARIRQREIRMDMIEPHLAAGRVTPAEGAMLAAIMQRLDAGDSIRFAGADGDVTEEPAVAFNRFLAALPVRVPYGELASGPVPPRDQEAREQRAADRAVQERARDLMKEARENGRVLSPMVALSQAETELST